MTFNGSFSAKINPGEEPNGNRPYYWPALLLVVVSVAGILGNSLVCLAIGTERRLQNRTNWFLFSLALADMIVSGVVIPLAIVKEFIGFWILGPVLCDLWIFFDVCSCTSSIMHIVVISIDRYLAIKDPLNVRSRQEKHQICLLIALIWTIAIFLSSPLLVLGLMNSRNVLLNQQCLIDNQFFIIYGSVVSFVIPLTIVIVMYVLTVHRLKQQIKHCQSHFAQERATDFSRRRTASASGPSASPSATELRRKRLRRQRTSFDLSHESLNSLCAAKDRTRSLENNSRKLPAHLDCLQSDPTLNLPAAVNRRRLTLIPSLAATRAKSSAVRNEQKAVKVLGVVFAIFVIAWFPFCILNLLQGIYKIDASLLNGFVWLGYLASSINPLVYTTFNRNFRKKFISLLKCECLYRTNRQRRLSYYQSHSSLHGSRRKRTNGLAQNDIRRFNAHRRPIAV